MEAPSEHTQGLLDETARLRAELKSLAKAAREGVESEREWQIAQQDKMRRNYEREIGDLREEARAREQGAWHREDMLSMKHGATPGIW